MLGTIVIIVSFIGITVVMGLALIPKFMDWVNKHYSVKRFFWWRSGLGSVFRWSPAHLGFRLR